MDIYINERSFIGQARPHTLIELMSTFAETLGILQRIAPDGEVVIHSSLVHQPLTDTLVLRDWLFSQEYRDDNDTDDDQAADPAADQDDAPLQALIGVVRSAISSGPWIDYDLDSSTYLCMWGDDSVDGSTIDGAAQSGGLLLSLGCCDTYPDGPFSVKYQRDGAEDDPRQVAHFVNTATARVCRRRYVPNPKHHPHVAKGDHSPMELDRAYDLFTTEREEELRDVSRDPWDTEVQRLLDQAFPGGTQLYARVWSDIQKEHIYYVFQNDNMNGSHGYPLPTHRVPQEVVNEINRRDRRKADS